MKPYKFVFFSCTLAAIASWQTFAQDLPKNLKSPYDVAYYNAEQVRNDAKQANDQANLDKAKVGAAIAAIPLVLVSAAAVAPKFITPYDKTSVAITDTLIEDLKNQIKPNFESTVKTELKTPASARAELFVNHFGEKGEKIAFAEAMKTYAAEGRTLRGIEIYPARASVKSLASLALIASTVPLAIYSVESGGSIFEHARDTKSALVAAEKALEAAGTEIKTHTAGE